MASLIFAPSARQDLLDIFDYIAGDKPIAAANWIEKIEEKCKLIATAPGFGERRLSMEQASEAAWLGVT